MQPRCRRRRSRRGGAFLSACPRYPKRRGAPNADRSFRAGSGRAGRAGRVASALAGAPRPALSDIGGVGMRPASLRTVYPGPGGFDPQEIKREFPIFASNPGLVFLDSGASAQKPRSVIDRISNYYSTDYANVHRGVYRLSARSTELFEEAREKMRAFLNAADSREIVFVRGATEGINLVAQSWGATFLKAGDEVLISELEHHSNIVPWQLLRDRIGIRLVVAPIDATGGLDLASFEALLSPRTRLVAVTHLANATGALVPIETITRLAHRPGAKVLNDGDRTSAV